MTSLDNCKVMVKDVPEKAEEKALKEEFSKWGGVVHVFYKGPGSFWACVEFTSQMKRDDFLKDKKRHFLWNNPVQVSEFKRPPKGQQHQSGQYGNDNLMSKSLNTGVESCKVMIKDIPSDADEGTIKKEFSKWGHVTKIYFRGTGHPWAAVEFSTQEKRDDFLKAKQKHKYLDFTLDVQPFKRPKAVQSQSSDGNSNNSSSNSTYYGVDQHRVMVKDVPIEVEEDELVEEVKKWGNVISVYYRGPGSHWASVEFDTLEHRNDLLFDKSRHKLWDVMVDVQEFKKPPKGPQPPVVGSSSVSEINYVKKPSPDKPNNGEVGDENCRVMVKDVPYDADYSQLEEEFGKWGRTHNIFYKGPGYHWATVDFYSVEERNEFLKQKDRHKVLNNVVNCMPFIVPSKQPFHLLNINGNTAQQQQTEIGSSPDSYDFGPAIQPKSPLTQMAPIGPRSGVRNDDDNIYCTTNFPLSPVSGIIMNYLTSEIGILRTTEHGNGLFHVNTAFFCNLHQLSCRERGCSFYVRCEGNEVDITGLLPVGTQVNIVIEPLNVHGPCLYEFQASILWPQTSIQPNNAVPLDPIQLVDNVTVIKSALDQQNILKRQQHISNSLFQHSQYGLPIVDGEFHSYFSEENSNSPKTNSGAASSISDVLDITDSTKNCGLILDDVDTMVNFFSHQFKANGKDPNALGLENLAFKILNVLGNPEHSEDKLELLCIAHIWSLIKEKTPDLIKDKITGSDKNKAVVRNIVAQFKPMIQTLITQRKLGIITLESVRISQDIRSKPTDPDDSSVVQEGSKMLLGDKIEELEKNLEMSIEEKVGRIDMKIEEKIEKAEMGMEEKVEQYQVGLEQIKKEHEELKSSFGKLVEHVSSLTQKIQTLNSESRTRNKDGMGIVEVVKNDKRKVVKICLESGKDTYELMTNDKGELYVASVKAIFNGVTALKYKLEGAIRICNQNGDIFESPHEGWGNRIYFANIPDSSNGSSGSPISHNIADIYPAGDPRLYCQPGLQGQYSLQAIKNSMYSGMMPGSSQSFHK